MNKKGVLRILQCTELIPLLFIIITTTIIIITEDDIGIRTTFIGCLIGGIIGAIYSIFVTIPKKFGTKDERTIVIEILAELVAISLSFGAVIMCLLLVATEVITLDLYSMVAIVLVILVVHLLIAQSFRKIINNLY